MEGGALVTSPIVFGAMWRRLHGEEEARARLIRDALELGITSIDTAPLYGFGSSEEVLGRALVGVRWARDHYAAGCRQDHRRP